MKLIVAFCLSLIAIGATAPAHAACKCEVGDVGRGGIVYVYVYDSKGNKIHTLTYKSGDDEGERRANRACEQLNENDPRCQ